MPQVEDQSVIAQPIEDSVNRGVHPLTAGNQMQRIKVALNGNQRLDFVPNEIKRGLPVDTDGVDASLANEGRQMATSSLWRSD